MSDDDADGAGTSARTGRFAALANALPRRKAVWAVGAAVVAAATSAVAIAATNGNAPAATPTTSDSPIAAQQADALDAIVGPNAEVRQPVAKLVQQGKVPKATYAGDTGTVGVPKNAKAPKQAKPGTVPQFVAGPLSGSFSLVQMASLAMQAGCSASQAAIAAAIGAAESAGNPGAQGDITLMDGTWDWSEGLWQIRGLRSERNTGGLRDSVANADPAKNAAAMLTISSGCTNWTPWSTYNSGAYLSYLGLSKTAADAANKYHAQTGSFPPVGSAGSTAPVPVATTAKSTGSGTKTAAKPGKPGRSSTSHRPKPSTSSSTAKSSSSSTRPHPKTSTSKPAPTSSSTPKPSLSLPIKLPTALPSSLPIKLPTKLPTSLPISLPVSLPPLPSLPITLP